MKAVIRVLLADHDPLLGAAVEKSLADKGFLCFLPSKKDEDLLTAIRKTRPHVLLLDRKHLSVLKDVRLCWDRGELVVVIVSALETDDLALQAARLGADYYLRTPFNPDIFGRRLRELVEEAILAFGRDYGRVQAQSRRLFNLLGMPPSCKGYHYLLEGVWLAIVYPHWLNSVTEKLYPSTGDRFGVSGAQVERAIRYALETTWEKGNLDELYNLFPFETDRSRGKPTNSAFIAKMADLVLLALDV